VPTSNHVRFSDKRVEDLSAPRKTLKVNLRPSVRLVCLHISEWTLTTLDDPLSHQWLFDVLL
jgi:hypothetical protein